MPSVYQMFEVLQKNCIYNVTKLPEKRVKIIIVSNLKVHESDIGQLVKLMHYRLDMSFITISKCHSILACSGIYWSEKYTMMLHYNMNFNKA